MKCEKCNAEHDGSFGSGRYCSKKCAMSRTFSEETKQKKREASINRMHKMKTEEPIKWAEWCEKQRTNSLKHGPRLSKERKAAYDSKPWEELGKDGKRRRVIDEQKHACNLCGLSRWRGEKISLEIEHKDGNHFNDLRENLEALCPNCHSLTETWRGRNKDSRGKVSDEFLLEALQKTETIRQALIVVGLSPRGKNYVRAKNLLATLSN